MIIDIYIDRPGPTYKLGIQRHKIYQEPIWDAGAYFDNEKKKSKGPDNHSNSPETALD